MTTSAGDAFATLGIALRHPTFGDVVTTAGHLVLGAPGEQVFPAEQVPAVQLAGSAGDGALHQGAALKAVRSPEADYALIRPADLTCQNLFEGQSPIGIPFLPSDEDIGTSLFVLTSRGALPTTFQGVHGSLPVGSDGLMQDLLVTTFATVPGDSGSCLVDIQSRAWGLLVGTSVLDGLFVSVFISAGLPLARESATFL